VRVDPEHGARTVHAGEPPEGSERDGVVAPEDERAAPLACRIGNAHGDLLARRDDRAEVARALVAFAAKVLGSERRVAIVHDGKLPAAREAALNEARRAAFAVTDDAEVPRLDALPARRCDTVVFLGGTNSLDQFVSWARAHEWLPDLLLPAASASPESLEGVPMKMWIALPTGPFDRTPSGVSDYRALGAFGTLRPEYPTLQFAALAGAELMVDALRRAGRELTREGFLAALDGIRHFKTGLVPPLSFSSTRHIGSTGAWIAPVDGEEEMVWVEA
jgi:hypothetical protein